MCFDFDNKVGKIVMIFYDRMHFRFPLNDKL